MNGLSRTGLHIVAICTVILLILSTAWATTLSWNLVIPYILGIRELSVAEVFALMVLIRIFTGVKPVNNTDGKTTKQKGAIIARLWITPWVGYLLLLATFKLFI